jgi:hypothetical protein
MLASRIRIESESEAAEINALPPDNPYILSARR